MLIMDKKRMLTCFLVIVILFLPIFSHGFIIKHLNHHCTGEKCPICAAIKRAEALINEIGSAIPTVLLLIVFFCFSAVCLPIKNQIFLLRTPVKLKVRMDD
ncbi:hypothetical protein [Anaerosacchariphilus polymeriproducens]|uniref:Uncharacterized protein n=1 Tax=Anaerosacchariphilus polymeriproducens TaxID=1812858 RepID=A0A371AW37_9FIRM|nr:hypothetical protein [Anaerosacchariphilus polymeriproducens]RDU23788.1 hypothetical protein DWV06_07990 [Anaerosacchariphilus polymeriproducens]